MFYNLTFAQVFPVVVLTLNNHYSNFLDQAIPIPLSTWALQWCWVTVVSSIPIMS